MLSAQRITRNLLREKPPGWKAYLQKYLTDDGLLLGDFHRASLPSQANTVCVNLKLISNNGDIIIKVRTCTSHDSLAEQ